MSRVGRARRRPGLPLAACATALAFGSPGCPQETEREPARFVARFAGGDHPRDWRPEARTKILPQRKPGMLIYEVTQHPRAEPSEEQRRAAEALIDRCHLAAVQRGWYDFGQAMRDGYRRAFNDEAHYVNEEYLLDGRTLDPERPEYLMYYDTSRGKSLVGFMFYVSEIDERGEQIGGPLTVWHYHVWSRPHCFAKRGLLAVGFAGPEGECERGEPSFRSAEMLHVWLVDHPHGPFATRMRIDPRLLEHLVRERGY